MIEVVDIERLTRMEKKRKIEIQDFIYPAGIDMPAITDRMIENAIFSAGIVRQSNLVRMVSQTKFFGK